jgi:CRISPR-associated protein Cmr2
MLESRHAFSKESRDIALALIDIYFPSYSPIIKDEKNWWNCEDEHKRLKGGILGETSDYRNTETGDLKQIKINEAINNWIINLAKIGFHLCH